MFVCFVVAFFVCSSNLALGSLGEATGELVFVCLFVSSFYLFVSLLHLFVCFIVTFLYLSNLALGSLGEATGEPVGRGDEQEESWVPSLRN